MNDYMLAYMYIFFILFHGDQILCMGSNRYAVSFFSRKLAFESVFLLCGGSFFFKPTLFLWLSCTLFPRPTYPLQSSTEFFV